MFVFFFLLSFFFLFLSRGFSLHRDEDGGGGHTTAMENEKRMRREIANSNERRRMQSINAGFQSLRSLLPHHEGEKLSKVSAEMQNFTTSTTISLELYLSTQQSRPADRSLRYNIKRNL